MSDGRPAIPPFQAFLEEQRTAVYRFLVVAVGPADADDCFQETFLAALRAYPELRDAENLGHWVLKIATRKAIDARRARLRRPVPSAGIEKLADRDAGVADLAWDPDHPLWTAVRALPTRQRIALVHRHVLDRPYAEIATLMGSSEATARANVHQGMKKVREAVGEE